MDQQTEIIISEAINSFVAGGHPEKLDVVFSLLDKADIPPAERQQKLFWLLIDNNLCTLMDELRQSRNT